MEIRVAARPGRARGRRAARDERVVHGATMLGRIAVGA